MLLVLSPEGDGVLSNREVRDKRFVCDFIVAMPAIGGFRSSPDALRAITNHRVKQLDKFIIDLTLMRCFGPHSMCAKRGGIAHSPNT